MLMFLGYSSSVESWLWELIVTVYIAKQWGDHSLFFFLNQLTITARTVAARKKVTWMLNALWWRWQVYFVQIGRVSSSITVDVKQLICYLKKKPHTLPQNFVFKEEEVKCSRRQCWKLEALCLNRCLFFIIYLEKVPQKKHAKEETKLTFASLHGKYISAESKNVLCQSPSLKTLKFTVKLAESCPRWRIEWGQSSPQDPKPADKSYSAAMWCPSRSEAQRPYFFKTFEAFIWIPIFLSSKSREYDWTKSESCWVNAVAMNTNMHLYMLCRSRFAANDWV